MSSSLRPVSAYAQAVRQSWTQLENDIQTHYNEYKAAGCTAVMLVDDTYDREYNWFGLSGEPSQIAASYHESEDPQNHSSVLILLDLTVPLAEQWPYEAGTLTLPHLKSNPFIAETLRGPVEQHDKAGFKSLSIEDKVKNSANMHFLPLG